MQMVINPNCNKTFNTQIDIPLSTPFQNAGHPYIIYDIQIDLAISPSRLHWRLNCYSEISYNKCNAWSYFCLLLGEIKLPLGNIYEDRENIYNDL